MEHKYLSNKVLILVGELAFLTMPMQWIGKPSSYVGWLFALVIEPAIFIVAWHGWPRLLNYLDDNLNLSSKRWLWAAMVVIPFSLFIVLYFMAYSKVIGILH